ncbi:heme/hemin ABC transporter substrate-binding protein [Roseospirillum parvum]|uniref:Iron complex transport system substrate-binding protein n=1 Tax=Roseospirillum parvum TaxID=83401 RepID=A0A1G8AP77_9PROT|nr:ABC transporter substrate-binding protein [Roseospirillum parvum]SDH22060.1 iron complex transport system substrate-binding protein [Roseospirillum parvum]
MLPSTLRWRGTPLFLCALLMATPATQAQAEAPRRIVSVGGALTEIVFALGAGERVVAVDTTSTYPPAATELPDVGYMRRLSAEPILGLTPDLVMLIENSGPAAALDQLAEAGTPLLRVADRPSLDGVADKITAVAEALELEAEGAALTARLKTQAKLLETALAGVTERPRVLFLLSAGRGAPMAGGTGTSAEAIIELAGGRNAVADFADYKPLSPEAAASLPAEVILVSERTLEALGDEAALAANPAFAGRRVVAMDGMFLLGFGPRTVEAAAELARHLHPDLKLPDLSDPQLVEGAQ